MVGVCLPSRGLVYSRTVQSAVGGMQALNKVGIATTFHISHDLPIPDGHNFCIDQAFQYPVDKIFIIEEDNYIAPDAFVALATNDNPISILQYNDKNGSPHGIIHYNEAGEVMWGGVGAFCAKKEVFTTLGRPWFRIDTRYRNIKKHLKDGKLVTEYEEVPNRQKYDEQTGKFIDIKDPYIYGGLDIDFYTRARKAGYIAKVLPEYKSQHFKLVKLGEPYINQGIHDIQQV